MHKILLYYKYTYIEDPKTFQKEQMELCKKLNLKGRVIVAHEGINGTLEGKKKDVEKYCDELKEDFRFADTHFKLSDGSGITFPRLSIKVRDEIVSAHLGEDDIDPQKVTGKYLMAEELHQWIKEGREFYIVDMRNDYEQEVGIFENSILPGLTNFRDLPQAVLKLAHLKDKIIVTVCTGGVRCEKASGFLVKHGFKNVYQLYGGIVTYMEKYPNEDFNGALYVFDTRVVMAFGKSEIEGGERKVIGKCAVCSVPCENYINCSDIFCHRHFICCEKCAALTEKCPMGCRDYSGEPKYLESLRVQNVS